MKWYHTPESLELNTPSRLDGVEFEDEARYRKEGARFIMDIGNKLGLYPFILIFFQFFFNKIFILKITWSYSFFCDVISFMMP